jgi:hypothetical protein
LALLTIKTLAAKQETEPMKAIIVSRLRTSWMSMRVSFREIEKRGEKALGSNELPKQPSDLTDYIRV